ncbi:MAG TPA: RNA polymerase sigma factor [Candidatus Edwardsbacteria bacterium]|nr:RNA polymerase sigma factor [Candidatus Edwardsbacteria bacterium]
MDPVNDTNDDRTLLAGIRSGDDAAFRALVERFQDMVYNTCLGLLQNREDAEDTAQDVFIKVHQSAKGFRGDARLSTWIYRIAVTASLDLLRSRKRKKRFAIVQSLFGTPETEEIADRSPFAHPGVALENKERAAVLFRAMATLPEHQRVAFTLHKVEGLSYQEIGEILQTTVPAVESLMHRAKENLRERLADYYQDQQ